MPAEQHRAGRARDGQGEVAQGDRDQPAEDHLDRGGALVVADQAVRPAQRGPVGRLPESWPPAAVATLAIVLLAALDLSGTFAAKEAVERRSLPIGALGAARFVLLFVVLAASLQYAELAPVTFGWVVALQVGVLLLDRFRYDAQLPSGAWIAIGLMIAAQAYLLLRPVVGPGNGAG